MTVFTVRVGEHNFNYCYCCCCYYYSYYCYYYYLRMPRPRPRLEYNTTAFNRQATQRQLMRWLQQRFDVG